MTITLYFDYISYFAHVRHDFSLEAARYFSRRAKLDCKLLISQRRACMPHAPRAFTNAQASVLRARRRRRRLLSLILFSCHTRRFSSASLEDTIILRTHARRPPNSHKTHIIIGNYERVGRASMRIGPFTRAPRQCRCATQRPGAADEGRFSRRCVRAAMNEVVSAHWKCLICRGAGAATLPISCRIMISRAGRRPAAHAADGPTHSRAHVSTP